MKKYHKYIIGLYFSTFVRTLLFLAAIIVSIKTLNMVQRFSADSPLNFKTFVFIVVNILPYVVYIISPFALTIAAVNVFSSLLSSSQVAILQNARLSNFKIVCTQMVVTVSVSLIMMYLSSFIIPETFEARNEIQSSVIEEKIKSLLTPDTIKSYGNITIITSKANDLKHIPMTFIHRKENDSEFVFVGNVQDTWSTNHLIGINSNNATILTIKGDDQNLIQFHTLETQIDLFSTQDVKNTSYLYDNTLQLLKKYQNTTDRLQKTMIIEEMHSRITPCLMAILLPFGTITILIKLHRNRSHFNLKQIFFVFLMVSYTMVSCFVFNDIFNAPETFWVVYANIILTFCFIPFLNRPYFFIKKV